MRGGRSNSRSVSSTGVHMMVGMLQSLKVRRLEKYGPRRRASLPRIPSVETGGSFSSSLRNRLPSFCLEYDLRPPIAAPARNHGRLTTSNSQGNSWTLPFPDTLAFPTPQRRLLVRALVRALGMLVRSQVWDLYFGRRPEIPASPFEHKSVGFTCRSEIKGQVGYHRAIGLGLQRDQ